MRRSIKKTEKRPQPVLAEEVARVASALEKQNQAGRKLLMGLLFGIGTAVGASIVASIIVVLYSRTLMLFGLENLLPTQTSATLLEQQIKLQTPQDQ
ncbi:MAG: hypothetical protein ABH861_00460 [Patescibacteria group bacterium]|nr:hypothetical protein [Patescibacteria group bacterium]